MQTSSKPVHFRWLLPVVLVFSLSACSAVELAYSIAPRLAVKFADEYFYLSNRQEARALALFKARKRIHQTEELPRYYAFADRLDERFKSGLTKATLEASLDEGEILLREGLSRTLPAISEIMADLDADQVNFFLGKLKEKEDEYRKRIAEGESERDREANEFEDLEEWTGELGDEQKGLVRQHLANMHDNRELWLQWRVDRNRMLGELLRTDPAAAEIEEFLARSWVARGNIPETLAVRAADNREHYVQMILDLQETLSATQRENVRERISESRDLILALMPDDVKEQLLAGVVVAE